MRTGIDRCAELAPLALPATLPRDPGSCLHLRHRTKLGHVHVDVSLVESPIGVDTGVILGPLSRHMTGKLSKSARLTTKSANAVARQHADREQLRRMRPEVF